jgi:hypothetical protein
MRAKFMKKLKQHFRKLLRLPPVSSRSGWVATRVHPLIALAAIALSPVALIGCAAHQATIYARIVEGANENVVVQDHDSGIKGDAASPRMNLDVLKKDGSTLELHSTADTSGVITSVIEEDNVVAITACVIADDLKSLQIELPWKQISKQGVAWLDITLQKPESSDSWAIGNENLKKARELLKQN